MLDVLLHDPKFWTALLFLAQTLVFYFLPAFPQEIWAAITALLAIVFAALTTRSTVQTQRAVAAAKRAAELNA